MASTGDTSEPPPAPNTKSFSLTINASKPKSGSSLIHRPRTSKLSSNGIKRPHSSLHESDNEEGDSEVIQAQLVTGFDHAAGGAIGIEDDAQQDKKRTTPLVIARLRNRDWREESRRRRGPQSLNHVPPVAQRRNGDVVVNETKEDVAQSYGLSFVRKQEEEKSTGGGADGGAARTEEREDEEGEPPRQQKTEDELALEALTSDKSSRKSNLVLPAVVDTQDHYTSTTNGVSYSGVSEDDAFRADVLSRPDPASLDDYAAVPVEEFGAALLRGMGWKEGDVVGKRKDVQSKPRIVERRPALLGLGAKEVPGAVEELGAWGKATTAATKKGGRRKPDLTYNPVVLRNSKTGEMLTEEELKGRMMEEEKRRVGEGEEEGWRERRDRNLRLDRERKDRDRGGGRSRSRDRDRRRDRDRDKDRDRDRDTRSNGRYDSPSSSSTPKRDHQTQHDPRHRRYDDDDDRDHRRDYDSSPSSRRERDQTRDNNERDRDRDHDKERDRAKRHDRGSRYANNDDDRYDSSASSRKSSRDHRDHRQGREQRKEGSSSDWRRRREEEVY